MEQWKRVGEMVEIAATVSTLLTNHLLPAPRERRRAGCSTSGCHRGVRWVAARCPPPDRNGLFTKS